MSKEQSKANASKAKKTDLTVQEENKSVTTENHFSNIPGLEGIESDMILIPRLKLVQKSSEEIMEFDMKPGTFCDSVTKEIVGDPPKQAKDGMTIEIIPVFVSNKTRIFFADFNEGGGILCQAKDGKTGIGKPGGACRNCKLKDWIDEESPKCTEYINIFVYIPSHDSPIPLLANFGKTNMAAGRKLVNFLFMKQTSPWKFKFELSTNYVASEKGDHFVMKIKPAGLPKPEEAETAEGFYSMLSKLKYEIDNQEADKVVKTESDDTGQANNFRAPVDNFPDDNAVF